MSEIVSLRPGESCSSTLIVDSHQYYLLDDEVTSDLARGTEVLDGVIGPQEHVIQVATGVPCGSITVVLHLHEPEDERSDDVVSAEADLELPSGHLILTATWETRIIAEWPEGTRLRVRVTVRDRDAATTFATQETHEIWAWRTSSRELRWRSQAIDRIGAALSHEAAHLRIGSA